MPLNTMSIPALYTLKDPVPEDVEKALLEYDQLTRSLLFHRGIKTAKDATNFLEPNFDLHLHDPFLM